MSKKVLKNTALGDCYVNSSKLSSQNFLSSQRVYCCRVCIVAVVCIVVVVLCVLLSYVYLLYYVGITFFFTLRCRTVGQKSVFGRSCDRPSRHRFFLVSLCLKANAELVPKIPSCHYMLLMQTSRLKFSSNQFHVLYTCKITTATG